MSATEHTETQKVFGVAVPLDEVRVAAMSPPVDLIEWINGQRPFTTMFLINFASWADVKIETLMHEMTHVWQGIQTGPMYMVQAIEAQMSSEGYNYGYTDADTGEGAQARAGCRGGRFQQVQPRAAGPDHHAFLCTEIREDAGRDFVGAVREAGPCLRLNGRFAAARKRCGPSGR